MRKIANITWVTYYNFGTFLQAYALQQYILSLGYDDVILDDSVFAETHINWKLRVKKWIWSLCKSYRSFVKQQNEAQGFYEHFKKEHLIIESNVADIERLNETYECFVCGSDQIWNPFSLINPKKGFFFADFVYRKKISYAPSIGVSVMPLEYVDKFRSLIKDFTFLSARERPGQKIMQELSGKKVVNVVDPTLLLSKNQWEKLLANRKEKKAEVYVLGYFLTPNPIYIQTAKDYAHKKGLKFKMFYTDKSYVSVADELITAGPIEFIEAIRNAHFLFTDSFHGSIFASIFNTQFVTFKRFKDTIESQNSRVENLLEMMGIQEHLLSEENAIDAISLEKIDFELVWANLSPYIKNSKEYLINALK